MKSLRLVKGETTAIIFPLLSKQIRSGVKILLDCYEKGIILFVAMGLDAKKRSPPPEREHDQGVHEAPDEEARREQPGGDRHGAADGEIIKCKLFSLFFAMKIGYA